MNRLLVLAVPLLSLACAQSSTFPALRFDGIPGQLSRADDGAPGARGAPKRVALTSQKIELGEKVYFDTGKATIQPASFPLLDEVADVLREHSEIKRILVEGHTDNTGGTELNAKLSQERAEAVRAYLHGKGIAPGRLDAKGFGETRPVASNDDEKGREANRRVELTIQ